MKDGVDDDVLRTTEDLLWHPVSEDILARMDADEKAGGGDGVGGITTEFYRRIVVDKGGKDLLTNVRLRKRLVEACGKDESVRKAVWTMCRRDLLFWVNMFCFTYDPRNLGNPAATGLRKLPKVVPFVTWEYQDDAMRLVQWCIMNGVDGLIEKSRDMGASWICLTVYDWFFLFHEMDTFMMVSRKEDLVDKKEDPDCLFWKIDFINSHLPQWMCPEIGRVKCHMKNEAGGGTIDGESTTGDVGRGGRRRSVLLDEFGAVEENESQEVLNATNDNTDCRIFNSTPKGAVGAYYEQTKRDDIVKIRMHWSQHPHKREGLYTCEKGKCPLHPEGGHLHSKWYDRECRRRGWNPVAIAQELDIDYARAGGAFFSVPVLEAYIVAVCRYRLFEGELEFDRMTAMPEGLQEQKGGHLMMWVSPSLDGRVPSGRYGLGIDISEGTGASFSCISVGNIDTGEKVACYTNPNIKPYELARYAVALARFFDGAFMAWEANGPGREFGDEVARLNYTNVFYRTNIASKTRSQFPGWYSLPEEKISVFGSYRRALAERTFMNRDKMAVKECFKFVTDQNGVPTYQGGSFDLGRIGQSHGDVVVSDALLNMVFDLQRVSQGDDEEKAVEIPEFCLANRMTDARRKEREASWLSTI